uniref:Uncharacterized protein n=1 Tax=Nothoprocta perdicaria TaxID=30464 RepID=A0A8C6ZNI7_NOTPE
PLCAAGWDDPVKDWGGGGPDYLPFLTFAAALLVFAFFLADPLDSGSLRLADVMEPVTLKKSSRRPWVLPCRLLLNLLMPLRIRSSLNCFSPHMNLTSSSSFGSVHFSSTASGSTTSGSRKSFWASLCNQFSGRGYFLVSISRLGPMPRMLSQ